MKLLMLRGLIASGKSTFARDLVKKEPNWVRVNKDDLRAMIHDSRWNRENEKVIVNTRNLFVIHHIKEGRNVVVDDTNFATSHEKDFRAIAQELGAEFEIKDFDTPLDECLRRDALRPNPVGKKVIMKMWKENCKPKEYESPEGVSERCVCVDIDGTLAKNEGHRSFYDYTKVLGDSPNYPVISVVSTLFLHGYRIIILSGREDSCREDTIKWLEKYNIEYDSLHMRPTGDMRDDTVIKREIFEREVKPRYVPMAVFDDRPKVVRMWKNLGLFVFDCGDGIEF
jgi:predicted kinase